MGLFGSTRNKAKFKKRGEKIDRLENKLENRKERGRAYKASLRDKGLDKWGNPRDSSGKIQNVDSGGNLKIGSKPRSSAIQETASRMQNDPSGSYNASQNPDEAARLRGRANYEELINRNYPGLTGQQKLNMTEGANEALNRQVQGYQRQLTAQQGARGVKGGAAYAQNADLARMGTEAQQGFQRDLSGLDADLAMKKLAAAYAAEQGERGQSLLERQMAADESRYAKELDYRRKLEKKQNKQMSRI